MQRMKLGLCAGIVAVMLAGSTAQAGVYYYAPPAYFPVVGGTVYTPVPVGAIYSPAYVYSPPVTYTYGVPAAPVAVQSTEVVPTPAGAAVVTTTSRVAPVPIATTPVVTNYSYVAPAPVYVAPARGYVAPRRGILRIRY